jgi:TonB-linked SusC/RagA family outer membrane protein
MTKLQKQIEKTNFYCLFFLSLTLYFVPANAQNQDGKTIESEAIEKEITAKTVNSVTGRAAGLQVEDGQLKVRGQIPLYIVDGVPLPAKFVSGSVTGGNPLNWFNSTNLEKIEVLNDDAAAIYGAKGANGVVLITTKKRFSSTLNVDAQVSSGIQKVSRWYDFLSTEEYVDIRRKAYLADGIDIYTYKGDFSTNEEWRTKQAYDIFNWSNSKTTNWQKEFLDNTGKVSTALLNLSGGTGNTYFYITSDYYRASSLFLPQDGDGSTRTNNRVLVSHNALGGKLKINGSLSYSTYNTQERGGEESDWERQQKKHDETTYLNAAPNQPAYNQDGSLYWLPEAEGGTTSFINPIQLKYSTANKNNTSLFGTGNISYRFFRELEGLVNVGYTRENADSKLTEENAYQNIHFPDYAGYKNRITTEKIYSDVVNIEPQLVFNRPVGNGKLSAQLGATYQQYNKSGDGFEIRDFDVESLFRNYGTARTRYEVSSESSQRKYASVWSRAGYDFLDRYLLNLTFRRDGSSKYERGHRYGNFFATGAGWIFSKENWSQENLPFLNYGKLRGSFGTTGNDNVAASLYYDLYAVNETAQYNNAIGIYRSQVKNPLFSWEKTTKASVALELAAFNNNLQVNVEAYRHRSNSMYGATPLAAQAGLTAYMGNLPGAVIQNQGIEIDIVAPLRFGDFEWFSTLTFTLPENNKLIKFDAIEQAGYSSRYKVGFSTNTKRVYRFTGINPETGVPEVEDFVKDGKIDSKDKQFLYDFDVDFYGGLEQSFRYKGVRLDLFFYGEQRPHVEGFLWKHFAPVGALGQNTISSLALDYWTPDNPNAKLPGLTTSISSDIGSAYHAYYTESDADFTTGSFIRLKNVSLSYDLPKAVRDKFKAKQITVYAIGENLWIKTKSTLWDPETGYDIPQLKILTAGVKVRF